MDQYRLSIAKSEPVELYQPEDYILGLGGKRLRPLLALIACDIFDKEPALALDSALCVELFHNFSLIHDDILDAAPLRRNHATVHKKWNTNIAILSGDMMLVKAFQALQNYSAEEFMQLSAVFSKTSIEVCEGQQMDMNFEKEKSVSEENYLKMITCKTAVLLGCSLQMGAINARGDKEDQTNLYEFGKHLGIAFQLLDDYLDAYAQTPEFGKQIGGDILANKKTYLLIKAYALANQYQRKELDRLINLDGTNSEEKINGVKHIFNELAVTSTCLQLADEHTRLAITHLDNVKAGESKKNHLKDFALELLKRRS
ncbi:MAG: polyprenyl synthetase family protein [Bacteroidetes bacterium]|nr:polyprenyl synthetase family protein [Bacteroidota bacterium]